MIRMLPLCVLLLAGCATADRAQFADGATTLVGLSSGFAEANPVLSGLSGPAILAVKLGATQAMKQAPAKTCRQGLYLMTGLGYSAALWNVGVLAGAGPAAIPVAVGLWVWRNEAWKEDAVKNCPPILNEIVRVKLPDGRVVEM